MSFYNGCETIKKTFTHTVGVEDKLAAGHLVVNLSASNFPTYSLESGQSSWAS